MWVWSQSFPFSYTDNLSSAWLTHSVDVGLESKFSLTTHSSILSSATPPPPQMRASPIHHPGNAPLPCIVPARGKHILNCFAYLSHSFIDQNNGTTYTLYINYATSKQTLNKTPLSASYIYSCYRTKTMELHTLCTLTTQRVNKRAKQDTFECVVHLLVLSNTNNGTTYTLYINYATSKQTG